MPVGRLILLENPLQAVARRPTVLSRRAFSAQANKIHQFRNMLLAKQPGHVSRDAAAGGKLKGSRGGAVAADDTPYDVDQVPDDSCKPPIREDLIVP